MLIPRLSNIVCIAKLGVNTSACDTVRWNFVVCHVQLAENRHLQAEEASMDEKLSALKQEVESFSKHVHSYSITLHSALQAVFADKGQSVTPVCTAEDAARDVERGGGCNSTA